MKKQLLLLAFLSAVLQFSHSQTRIDSLITELKNPDSRRVLVVAHRGDWRNAPENSLQAFRNCIDNGVDMIELDLKKSKDGHLIVMHDRTIDRTTSGDGKPEDYTLDELKQFRLRNGLGRITPHQVPTLEEVLILSKGKILINIDKGYDYFSDVYELLQKTGTIHQVVIKSGHPLAKVKAENEDVLNEVFYMPIISIDRPDAKERIREFLTIKPVAIECNFETVTPEALSALKFISENNCKIWLNSLWPSLNAGYDDDTAVEQNKKEETWGWLIQQGATIIQTDRPYELIAYLKSKSFK